ncbi:MAG: hypothetical protein JW797_18485, partial [Bradymonadales bacterium]|nr:hypothetical protein [Bradymonadales bacterium]
HNSAGCGEPPELRRILRHNSAGCGEPPEFCEQLYSSACYRGLSSSTQMVAVADGDNGLREELSVHFADLQFILDYPYLNSHLYETAEALEFSPGYRERDMSCGIAMINASRSHPSITGGVRKGIGLW